MDLPNELRLARDAALRGAGQAELRTTAAALSQRYRAGHGAADGLAGDRTSARLAAAV